MLRPSQTTLSMKFADFFLQKLKAKDSPSGFFLVPIILHGKINQHGTIEYSSSLRHRDVEICSIDVLALYLFSHLHFKNEDFPNFEKRENWYKTMALKGDKPFEYIHYKAQHSTYDKVFKKIGIYTPTKSAL